MGFVEAKCGIRVQGGDKGRVGNKCRLFGSKMITKPKVITVVKSKAITRCECGDA